MSDVDDAEEKLAAIRKAIPQLIEVITDMHRIRFTLPTRVFVDKHDFYAPELRLTDNESATWGYEGRTLNSVDVELKILISECERLLLYLQSPCIFHRWSECNAFPEQIPIR